MGLELDASGFGLGTRSQRYAMVADDGVVSGGAGREGVVSWGEWGWREGVVSGVGRAWCVG